VRIAVSGASGLIGSALVPRLLEAGHEVVRMVRGIGPAPAGSVAWEPYSGRVDAEALRGVQAVVHLAGENVAARKWTREQKTRIRDSRVNGTGGLARALAGLDPAPRVWVAASAVGIYGDRGDETLTEESAPGEGFLAATCREWEEASRPAEAAGIRVVRPRIGMVLSARGGALARMLPVFRLGGGASLGSGRQYMSWIDIDDLVGALLHAIDCDDLSGPVNLTAPDPVTNRVFTRELGRALHRPAALAVPAIVVGALFGEMGREILLAGARAEPRRLLETGFHFRYPDLRGSLAHVLGAAGSGAGGAAGSGAGGAAGSGAGGAAGSGAGGAAGSGAGGGTGTAT
jgi:uncharacterized protein (TIGR01777 family)